jgi:hypothetical protein
MNLFPTVLAMYSRQYNNGVEKVTSQVNLFKFTERMNKQLGYD